MRPTRRGAGALGVVALAVGLAVWSGPRALNALAAPVLVAVLGGAVQVRRAGRPTVERERPTPGFPGEERTVALSVDGGATATISDHTSDGLTGDDPVTRSLPADVTLSVTIRERGVHECGPVEVTVTDALGLVTATYTVESRVRLLGYPTLRTVDAPGAVLERLGVAPAGRTAFERVREYVPGDRLRDVHWPSTARTGDLQVTEYTDPAADHALVVVAESPPNDAAAADAMATAAATLFDAAMATGTSAGLVLADGHLGGGHGPRQRRQAFEALARTAGGRVTESERADADVLVQAREEEVVVRVGDRTVPFDALAGRPAPNPAVEVAP